MPILVSSNWAASILGIVTFAATEGLLFFTTAPQDRLKKLKKNVLVGAALTLFAYSILFVWSTVQTIYDGHRDSVSRWQAVVNEKNSLKKQLQGRDEYIISLVNRRCPICTPKVAAQPAQQIPPPSVGTVRIASQKTIVSTNPQMPYALEVVLQTDAVIQPVAFALECDGDIGTAVAGFNGGGAYTKTKSGFMDNSRRDWGFEWESPAFTPDQPIIVTIFSKSYIRVMKLNQFRYSWP